MPIQFRARGNHDEPLQVVVSFGPPAHRNVGGYNRALLWSLVRAVAAASGPAPVMRQVMQIRTNLSAGVVEIAAMVLNDQAIEQVQKDILAAVDAVPESFIEIARSALSVHIPPTAQEV